MNNHTTRLAVKSVKKPQFYADKRLDAYEVRFQVLGEKNKSSGMNSRRPAIIKKVSTIFVKSEKLEKLLAGPALPKPGPTLVKAVTVTEKDVIRSLLSKETSTVPTPKNIR